MFFGGAVRTIIQSLYPAWWAFAYQIPIGLLVAYIIFWQQSEDRARTRTVLLPAAIGGGVGSGVYALLAMVPLPVTSLIGMLAMWFTVSFTMDRYLGADVDWSNRLTAAVCVPVWVLWFSIGAVFVMLEAT